MNLHSRGLLIMWVYKMRNCFVNQRPRHHFTFVTLSTLRRMLKSRTFESQACPILGTTCSSWSQYSSGATRTTGTSVVKWGLLCMSGSNDEWDTFQWNEILLNETVSRYKKMPSQLVRVVQLAKLMRCKGTNQYFTLFHWTASHSPPSDLH